MACKTRRDITITMALMTPTVRGRVPSWIFFHGSRYLSFHSAQQDTDSEADVYGRGYTQSAESLGQSRMGPSESSATAFAEYTASSGAREPYPAWTVERQIPLSKEEIEDIFLDLAQKFGFQRDSMRNMVCICFISCSVPPYFRSNDIYVVVRFPDAASG
jgi:hypothetical protein